MSIKKRVETEVGEQQPGLFQLTVGLKLERSNDFAQFEGWLVYGFI